MRLAPLEFSTFGVIGYRKSDVANDKANDPPRDDYLEPVLAEKPAIDLSITSR